MGATTVDAVSDVARLPAPRLRALIVAHMGNQAGARRAAETFDRHHDRPADMVIIGGADPPPGISVEEWCNLSLVHPATELVAAVRPRVVAEWTRRPEEPDSETVWLILPSDAEVHGNLVGLASELCAAPGAPGLAMFVTRRSPAPRDGRMPDEVAVREMGRLDHDLFAVRAGPVAQAELAWWADLQRPSAHVDPDRQRAATFPWLDSAPFEIHRFADPALGVNFANADEPARLPAQLIRFPGFDPIHPWRLSPYPWARVWPSRHPWLRMICRQRAEALLLFSGPHGARDPGTVLPGGQPIDAAMRRAYERGLIDTLATAQPHPPHPWRDGEPAFIAWLNTPRTPTASATRYLSALWELRPDLQAQRSPAQLADWARVAGREDGLWWRLILPDPREFVDTLADRHDEQHAAVLLGPDASVSTESAAVTTRLTQGVNVVGFLRGELGVGEHGRLLLDDVRRAGQETAAVSTSLTAHRQEFPFAHATSIDNPHDVNLLVVYPDALPDFIRSVGPEFFADRINIGAWAWEVEGFPAAYHAAFDLVDEVWVESEHVRRALAAVAPAGIGIEVIPLGVRLPAELPPETQGGAQLTPTRGQSGALSSGGASTPFTFLFVFDHASVTDRKNPWGLVEAYRRAFPRFDPDPSATSRSSSRPTRLLIKSINGDLHLDDHERLLACVAAALGEAGPGGRGGRLALDIEVRDGFVSSAELAELMAGCDAYVSLHRAEGWGLTMAEAMAGGKPVIATGYSGNVDFMTPENSWLVPYRLVDIPETAGPYAGCGRWAEPDLDAAAAAMRDVYDNPERAATKAQQGAAGMRARAISDAGPDKMAARLAALRSRSRPSLPDDPRRSPLPMPSPPPPEPPPRSTSSQPSFEHPGLGPVLLPVPAPRPSPTRGVGGFVRKAAALATAPQANYQEAADHERDVAVAHAIGETRLAIRSLADEQHRLRDDLATFTTAVAGAITHLEALQVAHDHLARERIDADAELAARLRRDIADLRSDLDRARLGGAAQPQVVSPS